MIGFIIGFVLGSWFSIMIAAAVAMAKNFDKRGGLDDQDRG